MALAIIVQEDGKAPVQVDVDVREPPGPFESLEARPDEEFDALALLDAASLRGFLTRLVSDAAGGKVAAVCYRPRVPRLRALLAELRNQEHPIVVRFDG